LEAAEKANKVHSFIHSFDAPFMQNSDKSIFGSSRNFSQQSKKESFSSLAPPLSTLLLSRMVIKHRKRSVSLGIFRSKVKKEILVALMPSDRLEHSVSKRHISITQP